MNEKNKFRDEIAKCITFLNERMLILYPTDTVWGIGCDAQNDEAVQKIIDLKHRTGSKSFVIMVSTIEQIGAYASLPSPAMLDHRKYCSKPVTFVLNNAKELSPRVINEDGSVAIRVPQDEFCMELLRQYGKPLVSTSANISGEPTPSLYKEISHKIIQGVDHIVGYNQDDEVIRSGSRIIRLDNEGNIEILRD